MLSCFFTNLAFLQPERKSVDAHWRSKSAQRKDLKKFSLHCKTGQNLVTPTLAALIRNQKNLPESIKSAFNEEVGTQAALSSPNEFALYD